MAPHFVVEAHVWYNAAMAATKTPRCTVESVTVEWIVVRGEKPAGANALTVREDGGLISRLLEWMGENDIYPARGTPGTVGGGLYARCHYPADAKLIAEWLRGQGVKPA